MNGGRAGGTPTTTSLQPPCSPSRCYVRGRACGSGSGGVRASDPNTLEVWTRSNPDDAASYDRVFAAFTKKTGIKIGHQAVLTFDQQLQSRASGKDLPDVMVDDTALMGSYQAQGLLEPVVPDSIAGPTARSPRRPGRPRWAPTAGHYGIPYSGQAMTLMVRTDWREKPGLPRPRTWQGMLTLAEAFATRDPTASAKNASLGARLPVFLGRGADGRDGHARAASALLSHHAVTTLIRVSDVSPEHQRSARPCGASSPPPRPVQPPPAHGSATSTCATAAPPTGQEQQFQHRVKSESRPPPSRRRTRV